MAVIVEFDLLCGVDRGHARLRKSENRMHKASAVVVQGRKGEIPNIQIFGSPIPLIALKTRALLPPVLKRVVVVVTNDPGGLLDHQKIATLA